MISFFDRNSSSCVALQQIPVLVSLPAVFLSRKRLEQIQDVQPVAQLAHHFANVKETGTSQRMNSNSFNNKKSLSQQDGCDDHTRREKPARTYNSNTMPQGTTCWRDLFFRVHKHKRPKRVESRKRIWCHNEGQNLIANGLQSNSHCMRNVIAGGYNVMT